MEIAAAMYDTNVLGFKGPRRMTVVLPGMTPEGRRTEFRPVSDHDGLIGRSRFSSLTWPWIAWALFISWVSSCCDWWHVVSGISARRI
jgi:hypothetical protein